MNKIKKLLSVLLAVIMILSSMSILSSAAITQYKTVDNLRALSAYSPYGQVTRLSTEERASIVQDFLDTILPGLNINMGTISLAGLISVTLDLTSVDQLCVSLDSIKSTKNNFLFSIAAGIVDLGILETLDMDSWNTGIDRAGDSQLNLFSELFELLSNNTALVNEILTDGLDLGIVSSFLGSLDLSSINKMVTNLPGLIKGLVYPLIERWDDTLADIKNYDNSIANESISVEGIANTRIKALFTDNMSITTVKYDANGNMTSEHTGMPILTDAPAAPSATSPRCVYVVNGTTPGSKMTVYHIVDAAEAEALAKDADDSNNVAAYNYILQEGEYVLEEEANNGVYVWKAKNDKGEVTSTLKYYNDNSPLMPGMSASVVNEKVDLSNANISAGDLLYTFIPYLFEDLAVVVLNGSVKKILAEFFGAQFTYVGQGGPEADDAVMALADSSNAFFTEKQGDYVFEWSNYEVINGTHYYRFEDQIFVGDISKKNNYFDIINWDYEITGNFMDEFVPANDDSASDRLLLNFNDFLVKVATTITKASANTVDAISGYEKTWTRPTFAAGNANVINNIKAAAQAVISLAPQHIFGSDYATNPRCYYSLLMDSSNDNVLTGIAAQLVDIIMPSMTLPTAAELKADGTKVGAILAGVIREFAAYLAPEYNFDALIYADFGTTEADPVKTFLPNKTSEYWFDVCMTMGINIGYEYLRAFSDMGEDSEAFLGATNAGYGVDGKTYAAGTTQEALNAEWEGMLDYIIDWALSTDYEWAWNMKNLVEVDGLTIDLASAQDPWVKLEKILFGLIPFDEILTITTNDTYPTRIEKFLRYDLILGIVDLRWADLVNTIQFNGEGKYFRTGNVLDQLAGLLKDIVNGIFDKIGGGSYKLIPDSVTDFDSLATQAGIKTLAVELVGKLKTAYDNGLLVTVLPLLNMFLGWKTDPQVRAEPVISTTFRDGNDYAFQWTGQDGYPAIDANSTMIHFLNNSSGMLEIHRNSDVVDHEYAIQIDEVTSDATVNTLTFDYGDGYASPYETIDIKIGGTYAGEEAATITIAYRYIGKDGQGIGGTQYTSRTIFFSNQYEDKNVTEPASTSGDTTRNAYNKYIFTEDIYNTVTNQTGSISQSGRSDKSVQQYEAPAVKEKNQTGGADTCDTSDDTYETIYYPYPDHDQYAKTYFDFNNQSESGWGSTGNSVLNTSGAASGKFFKGKDQYGADYDYPLGVYAFPLCLVTYDNVQCLFYFTFIHYDDHGIYEVYTDNMANGYNANQGVAANIYNEYNAAWKDIVKLATYPLMTELNGNTAVDYFKVIEPQLDPAMERFEAAKEAYEEALADAQASQAGAASASLPAYVEELREEIDNDFIVENGIEKEINFQDVEFYEYFNYNDVKVAAENLYRTYLAPEVLDTYHIFRSGIREAELNFVIAAEDNATVQEAIKASRRVHDQAAIDASIVAASEWKQPVNTKLFVEDLTSRLAYYKQFVVDADNREGADHMYFLNQELAHMAAQNLNAEDYEAVSWGRYADALAEAEKVAAGTDDYSAFNSRIYDVKYNLMVAYKQLLKKSDSLIEAGGTAALEANIEIAEGILAMSIDDIVLSDIAIEKGLTKEKALGHLIEGLGYYYQARYSKHDIEVQDGEKTEGELKFNDDGTPMMFNLYDESAYEYADNDRPNKTANQAKVNACNDNLEACIAYFELASAEPNTLMLKEDAPYEAVIDLENTNNGEFTGIIYGIDTLGWDDTLEADGTLADFLTTAYGDDYLEIIEADGGETTGTIINVLDDEGNVLETYAFIYFGDVDMNGLVESADGYMCEYYELNYEGIDSFAQFVAADIDGDGWPTSTDGYTMEYYELNYEGMPEQADVAAAIVENGLIYEMV